MGLSRLAIHFLSLLIRPEAREGNRVKGEEEKQLAGELEENPPQVKRTAYPNPAVNSFTVYSKKI